MMAHMTDDEAVELTRRRLLQAGARYVPPAILIMLSLEEAHGQSTPSCMPALTPCSPNPPCMPATPCMPGGG
jgi:hypothetical protein